MDSHPRREVPPISEISADIYFLQPSHAFETEKPFAFRYDVGEHDIPQTNMEMGPHPCTARNIRGVEGSFTLEKHGFEVVHVGDTIPYDDFHDDESLRGYFRVLEHVLKERLGASSVRAFRHGVCRILLWLSGLLAPRNRLLIQFKAPKAPPRLSDLNGEDVRL